MRQRRKAPPARSRPATARGSASMEKVLEACAQLASLTGETLRQHMADSAGNIFRADLAGILPQENDGIPSLAINADLDESAKKSLLDHVRPFAAQAIEQKKLLNFRFSSDETIYHGLAQPLITSGSIVVMLAVRSSVFSVAEAGAFTAMGNIARLALDNAELAGLCSAQKHDFDQLLDLSSELGATAQLESFLPRFVLRSADFLGFQLAFIALVESGDCRLRWGANKGSVSRLDVDVSTLAKRPLETRVPHISEDVFQLPAAEKAQLLRWEANPRQYLGMPLLTNDGRPLGVLGLADKKNRARITPEDVRRARALAAELTVALESADNLQLSDQHRRRTEDLMEMALDLGSALRLPDFVKNFTERVAGMIDAKSAILALAQGDKVESVGFYGARPERELQRKLNAAFSEYAERHPDLKITGSGVQAMGAELAVACGWQNLTLVRLEGTEGDLLGILALADISRELSPNDLNLLQALIVHASVALENSRLFTRITQSSRQWAEIFDSISDFIVVHDEQYEVLRVNRSLAEFIGVRPAELIGLSMLALVSIASDSPQPCPFCRAEYESDEYLHPVLERTYLVSSSRIHG